MQHNSHFFSISQVPCRQGFYGARAARSTPAAAAAANPLAAGAEVAKEPTMAAVPPAEAAADDEGLAKDLNDLQLKSEIPTINLPW